MSEQISETGLHSRIIGLLDIPAKFILGAPWNFRSHPENQSEVLTAVMLDRAGPDFIGFYDPLTVFRPANIDPDYVMLVDGHERQELISDRIGPETLIPCILTNLTEAEAKKALATHDAIGAMAAIDGGRLDDLQKEMELATPALQQMLDDLRDSAEPTEPTDEGEPVFKELEVLPPPKMTWVLVGIETVRFGEINEAIEQLAQVPGLILESTSNDG